MDWLAGDLFFYFNWADKFFQGLVPYKDYFLEYPPGAFLVFLFPRLFSSDFSLYILIFSAMMAIFFFLQTDFLLKSWQKTKKGKFWLGTFVLSSALLLPLSLMRFDLVPPLLILGATVLLFKGSVFKSGIFLAMATAVKIFPIILLPFFVIQLGQKASLRQAVKLLGGYFLTLSLLLLPMIGLGGQGFLYIFNYHFLRDTEVESLPASILFVGSFFGQEATFNSFASWNISVLGWDRIVSRLFLFLGLILSLAVYPWFYRQPKGKRQVNSGEFLMIKAILIAILIFIGFNKVFSPQYLIWLEPFVLWFILYLGRKKMFILGSLWCLVLILTMFNLANFWSLIALSQPIILTQILRNGVYLVFLVLVVLTKEEKFKSGGKDYNQRSLKLAPPLRH